MDAKLPKWMLEILQAEVQAGTYSSMAEAVRAIERVQLDAPALRAQVEQLRRKVAIATEQANRGEARSLDLEEVLREARERRKQRDR